MDEGLGAKENRLLAKHCVRVAWKEASMRRGYELIDMVVVIGFCTTIAAAGLLFLAANGTISISPAENLAEEDGQVIMGLDDARWLQPILGQAIVDQDLLDRRHAIVLSMARMRLAGVDATHTVIQEHLAAAAASATRTKL